ncbi:hypothetical protein RJ639_041847 [Escallonia herrerae]|uniref:FAD-binding oxidoreductase/transferase type 4 C-terminal domain-containing protein n=1 Tax=Escallonia herrerae TaxID=1293975 RepID=A0AA89B3M1_9ASTE|nr:hypothetical protein RJ639_041847 [Escallonia herrerae]
MSSVGRSIDEPQEHKYDVIESVTIGPGTSLVQLMASIKRLLDPNGILNPYKVLPPYLMS